MQALQHAFTGDDTVAAVGLDGRVADSHVANPLANRLREVEGPGKTRGLHQAADPVHGLVRPLVCRALLQNLQHLAPGQGHRRNLRRVRQQRGQHLARNQTGFQSHTVADAGQKSDVGARMLAQQIADQHIERAFRFVTPADAFGRVRHRRFEFLEMRLAQPVDQFCNRRIGRVIVVPQRMHAAGDTCHALVRAQRQRGLAEGGTI